MRFSHQNFSAQVIFSNSKYPQTVISDQSSPHFLHSATFSFPSLLNDVIHLSAPSPWRLLLPTILPLTQHSRFMITLFFIGWPDLGPKWVRLTPNGTNPGLCQIKFQYILAKSDKSGPFSDQISVHFGAVRQNVLKSDLNKSRICPIWCQSDHIWTQICHAWLKD